MPIWLPPKLSSDVLRPGQVEIDKSNPITQGMLGYYAPDLHGVRGPMLGGTVVDTSISPTFGRDADGAFISGFLTPTYVRFSALDFSAELGPVGTGATVLFRLRKGEDATNGFGMFGGGTQEAHYNWNGTVYSNVLLNSRRTFGDTMSIGQTHSFVTTARNVGSGLIDYAAYQDTNRRINSTSVVGSIQTGSRTFGLNTASVRPFDGALYDAIFWDRWLDQAEVEEVVKNPRALLRSKNPGILYFVPTAGVGGTIHEAALSLANNFSAAYTKNAIFEASATYTTEQEAGPANNANFNAELTQNITTALSTSSGATILAALLLAKELNVEVEATLAMESILSFNKGMSLDALATSNIFATVQNLALTKEYVSAINGILEAQVDNDVNFDQQITTGSSVNAQMSLALLNSYQNTSLGLINAIISYDLQNILENSIIANLSSSLLTQLNLSQLATTGTLYTGEVEYSTDYSQTFVSEITIEALQQLGLNLEKTSVAASTLNASIDYSLIKDFIGTSGSIILAAIEYALNNDVLHNITFTIDGLVSYNSNLELSTNGDISIEVSLPVELQSAINTICQSNLYAQTTLANQLSVQLISNALLNANISIAAIKDISVASFNTSATVVLPDGRTLIVSVENRGLEVQSENRILIVRKASDLN
jgi:hypothetical protein